MPLVPARVNVQSARLTVIASSRAGANGTGADYLYTYLRTFYKDKPKPTGWNNMVFPSVGMPHVLWELQGIRRPVFEEVTQHGVVNHVLKGWEQLTPGSMTPQQYDDAMGDLVGYLQWMGRAHPNDTYTCRYVGFTVPRRVYFLCLATQCRLLERCQVVQI